ncbi:ATP-dependent DNA helicase [Halococcoides cellulosivorans]|uniref:Helicase n=1 Tax=Halococcoides cellulosivorans TaxID=1679096 RepID=A0A2R4X2X5_9EURY|nr:ATP-dependent DNA helicase [Halococcoides cellulosivorans]AWB28134.1 helicase [Halococcoides cellulosivorans]
MDLDRLTDEFPAPEYRGNQAAALDAIDEAFAAGNEVVLVRAPTGSGKSLLARAIAGCARRPGAADPEEPVGAYYTTPQVSQLDDVSNDPLLDDLAIVRGKNNYDCILPGESTTPVDRAPCVREREFECDRKQRCPYYSDRSIASQRSIAAMTLAYFMQTAGSDVFGQRDVIVVDEAHGLREWAELYATIELDPSTVPVWEARPPPAIDDLGSARSYADGLRTVCERRLTELRNQAELDPDAVVERDRLETLRSDLGWFLETSGPVGPGEGAAGDDGDTDGESDADDDSGGTEWVVHQPDGAGEPVRIAPMNPERYLGHTVWDRGQQFALLSATILDKDAFCRGVGLDPDRVALVSVGHTFPVESRPLFDVSAGKMTREHRADTLDTIADTVVRIMADRPDEPGLIHCHSYDIQSGLADRLRERGVADRIRAHGRSDRDAQLATWKRETRPEVFLSVKMEEALDLEGDLARWQVLCKAPYPNVGDPRVERRLENDRWDWYYRTALRTVIQACGRIVRSPTDYGATYLADRSLLDLFDRARSAMPEWFAAQVDRCERPDLPPGDASAALAGLSGGGTDRRTVDASPVADVWDTD